MELLRSLLPDRAALKLESWQHDVAAARIKLRLSSLQSSPECPLCAVPSHQVHSRYERILTDLRWADYSLTLQLQVRKFFCLNPACQRRIFTERMATIAAPWARRTNRLAKELSAIGLALGGAAGARLSKGLGIGVSRNTILRSIARLPLPAIVPPQILGVDDFALRKRHRYGTILVDLERHLPIALLPTREAAPLAAWLQQHPEIQVLSRDRSKTYRSGMNQGAPTAIQVADRFHLLQNLAEVVEQLMRTHVVALKKAQMTDHLATMPQLITPQLSQIETPAQPLEPRLSVVKEDVGKEDSTATSHWHQRAALHQQIWQLTEQNWSTSAIARQLGVSIRTVQRDLNKPQFAPPQQRSDAGSSQLLDPYRGHILHQYQLSKGRPVGLLKFLRQQGYQGSARTLSRYLRQFHQSEGLVVRRRSLRKRLPDLPPMPQPVLNANRATWLILSRAEKRTPEDEQLIEQIKAQSSELSKVVTLAEGFTKLIRQRQGEQLEEWLQQAEQSHMLLFGSFASGLRDDYDAVKAAMTLEVSNGQVEGQINRLKLMKRQMYGRASLKLLERRFILTS